MTVDEWAAALESGDYRKAQGALRLETANGYRHCCLGVLCDIAEAKWRQGTIYNVDMASAKSITPEMFGPEISGALTSWIPLGPDGAFGSRRVVDHLVLLNDRQDDDDHDGYEAVVKFLRNLP